MSGAGMAADHGEAADHGKASTEQQPLFALPLRGGQLDLWHDRITLGPDTFLLADLVQAMMVPYATGTPGAVALGLLLRVRDGRAPLVFPDDVGQAHQLLDMVYTRRPDLRPFPPPFYQPYPPLYTGYAAKTSNLSGIPQNDRVWAMLSHLSVLFLPLWFPLVVWLVTQQSMPYASRQAKQAFVFHLIVGAVTLVVALPLWAFGMFTTFQAMTPNLVDPSTAPPQPSLASFGFFVIAWVFLLIVNVVNISFGIYAAVQTFQGKPFHYPLLGRL